MDPLSESSHAGARLGPRVDVRPSENRAKEADDANTADIFTELSRGIDKWLCFVETYFPADRQAGGRRPERLRASETRAEVLAVAH